MLGGVSNGEGGTVLSGQFLLFELFFYRFGSTIDSDVGDVTTPLDSRL